jgi:RNA methyltransferase, TrmH family
MEREPRSTADRDDPDFRNGPPRVAMDDPMEMKIFGVNACRAFFEHRQEQIVRAYFAEDVAYRFGYIMKACAKARKAYRIVDTYELDKIAETRNHQGICFLVKKIDPFTIKEYLDASIELETDCLVALERLGNPHNVGSILRTCAHFGVEGLLVGDAVVAQNGASLRSAEGGAEFVQFVHGGRLSEALPIFKAAGYTVVATSSHQGENLYKTELPDKILLMMGPESSGLSDFLIEDADVIIRVPGSENVESLNVATATGIILGEYWRQKEFEPGQSLSPYREDPDFEDLGGDDEDYDD